MPKKQPLDFENALTTLEALVERMEKGEISLEDSLRDFERGIELTRACQKALQEAEQKVQLLMEKGGRLKLEPFASDELTDDVGTLGGEPGGDDE